jgi:hypothetical protein
VLLRLASVTSQFGIGRLDSSGLDPNDLLNQINDYF